MKFDFSNKVAIVTGGGGGIGQLASIELAKLGAKVSVVDLNPDLGTQTVETIRNNGGEAMFIKADVSSEDDVKNYVKETVDAYGTVDVFLNNAGWEGMMKSLVDYPVESFDKVMNINVRGVFLGLKHVLPIMTAQNSGTIVNTASLAALQATPNLSAYGASKHAVLGLTKTAAVESAPHGVRVNAVCPGFVNTRMFNSISEGLAPGAAENVKQKSVASAPNGRYAEPIDIVQTMIYLASDLSSHIVGQGIVIDGGRILI
ncbi:SDR family NAD(P)-dependent oxidoreductase [Paenibacillus faecalis]|uniref:SDR family NAD(P)-dependent oxidoreductase n=1 Tax=Paenibacillus faecalis TaxID=2079532 RepID=UPI000D1013FF|nr:glucose 1-dehydrogenase [Paenibacillus faecalis]